MVKSVDTRASTLPPLSMRVRPPPRPRLLAGKDAGQSIGRTSKRRHRGRGALWHLPGGQQQSTSPSNRLGPGLPPSWTNFRVPVLNCPCWSFEDFHGEFAVRRQQIFATTTATLCQTKRVIGSVETDRLVLRSITVDDVDLLVDR